MAAKAPLPGSAIELKIPASSEWVRVARLTVAGAASRLAFGIDDIEDIKLAVAEAINNAIVHAPLPDTASGQPVVTVRAEVAVDGLHISVTDEGRMEDDIPVHDSEPRQGEDNLPEGGLGLLLIRSLMDEVSHEGGPDSDTTLHMFKRLPARAAGRPSTGNGAGN